MLIKRGECKCVEKVINAQKLGADLAIIYDEDNGDELRVIMKNDGHGHLAEIPSLFVSQTQGETLREADSVCPQLPVIRIPFSIQQTEKAAVTLWLDSNNVIHC